jgi:hypothetical protein
MSQECDKEIKPALLTRAEIDWLLGKNKVSKGYEYKLKSVINKKIQTLSDFEIPLLINAGFIDSSGRPLKAKTTGSNPVRSTFYQNKVNARSPVK